MLIMHIVHVQKEIIYNKQNISYFTCGREFFPLREAPILEAMLVLMRVFCKIFS